MCAPTTNEEFRATLADYARTRGLDYAGAEAPSADALNKLSSIP